LCDDHKTWTSDDWKYVIWSDESFFTLCPTSDRVYVWRTPKETYSPEWLVPTVKHGGGSVMNRAAVTWYPIITLDGGIIALDYVNILSNQVHPMAQMLFPNNAVFRDDNSPIHTARNVQSCFEEHEDASGWIGKVSQTLHAHRTEHSSP